MTYQRTPAYLYWTPAEATKLAQATQLTELYDIARIILQRMPQPLGQVCGPISNGGLGSITANLQRFKEVIADLMRSGNFIFDQMPFEDKIFELTFSQYNQGFKGELLNQFYLPIFESGYIKTLYFIPGWQSSIGACWEYQQAIRFGLEVKEID